ncbi:MAG: TlpA family protein disulfide reductase [Opitutaceae bacterium]|nr:TlpA family protein disulfide reductase [Opitutaceae bacterium]
MSHSFPLVALGLVACAVPVSHAQVAAPAAATASATATPASASSAKADLETLVSGVRAKLTSGRNTAADLAPELAQFDALLLKYQGDKSDEVGQILLMKAALYAEVLNDSVKGTELLKQVAIDFPGSKAAANADRMMSMLDRKAKATQTQAGLIGKIAPNLHFTWLSQDGPKTLDAYRGKVVVLDFWATWCGPCIASFPQVAQLVEHYKGTDVAVIGVTSLQGFVSGLEGGRVDTKGKPDKEMALMHDFIKAKQMTWTVAFSQEEVFNPDYGIMGIPYVAIIAPDGTVRHAGLHPGSSLEDKAAKIDAILKEFNLKTPAPAPKTS